MHQVQTGPHSWDRAACVLIQQAVSPTGSSVLQTLIKLQFRTAGRASSVRNCILSQDPFTGGGSNLQRLQSKHSVGLLLYDFFQDVVGLFPCVPDPGPGPESVVWMFSICWAGSSWLWAMSQQEQALLQRGLSTLQDTSPEDLPSTAELLSKHSSLSWFLQDKKQAGKYSRLPENSDPMLCPTGAPPLPSQAILECGRVEQSPCAHSHAKCHGGAAAKVLVCLGLITEG